MKDLAAAAALGVDVVSVPAAATMALEAGLDSTALRQLAGLTEREIDAASVLLRQALGDLGEPIPTKRDAVMHLARGVAGAIVRGEVSPVSGAREIWQLSLRADERHLPELDTFVYGASEWESRPEARAAFEDGIRRQARTLVDG